MSSSPITRTLRHKGAALLLAGALVLAACGGDDDGDAASGDGTDETTSESPPATLGIAPVAIEGEVLPEYVRGSDPDDDAAIGLQVPRIQGTTPIGRAAILGPNQDESSPTVIAVVAHWCPHCQAEVPRLVELFEAGGLPEGTRFMALSTNANENAPNYPPGEWLADEGWPGEIVLDDESATGMLALGSPFFPFVVVIDGEGRVVRRFAGENHEEEIAAALELAAAATPPD